MTDTAGSTDVTQAAQGGGGTRAADGARGHTRPSYPVEAMPQDGRGDSEEREPVSGPKKHLLLFGERLSPYPSCVSELRLSCRALITASLSAIPAGSPLEGFGSGRVWFGQVWVKQPTSIVIGAR